MSKRYPGQVARIRVSPSDFLSVVDVVDALGMRQPGMSFSSMVSIALSSCLEGLRQNGTIPEREGFEFNEVRATVMVPRNKKALFITDKFQSRTSDFRIAAPPKNSVQFMKTAEELLSQNGTMADDELEIPRMQEEVVSLEMRQARTRLAELNAKKELYDDGHPGIVWSARDQKDFDDLVKVVYG